MGNESDEYWQAKRYGKVIENIKDVIWELDTRLVFTYISPLDKEQRGFDPYEVIGQHLFTFLTDASQKYILKATNEFALAGQHGSYTPIVLPDVQQIRKDGHIIWTDITINPVVENGMLAAFVGSTRDVTERKHNESKLREYAERMEQLDQTLKRISTSDKSTRVVFNRDKLEVSFSEELVRAKRYRVGFSLVLFNIDQFKHINDTYGNAKGDDILVELEYVVMKFIREIDSVFRRGGDEFIVMLPHTTGEHAKQQAERMRQTIEQNEFTVAEKVTISAGTTEYAEGDTLESMINRAEMALYIAKRSGKNQVESR
jgi:diguanylate cyclase (GGDEF)-like protein/PAS domain S-box-containing protein